jgi:chitin disaccharide deacetylase
MSGASPPRPIWLCADDYGISPGVNRAIRDLINKGRLNATSVMVVAPAIGRDEVASLQAVVRQSPRCAVGLHVTLTAPFRPLSLHFRPLDGDMFLPFPRLLGAGLSRRLDPELIHAEVERQLATFHESFGRLPDFVDGHQHAQLYPVVRDGFLAAVKEKAPNAWVRQARRNQPLFRRPVSPKAIFLDLLSMQFTQLASRAGLATNPAFSGAYDYSRRVDYGALMRTFLVDLPEHGLVMCHPGFVDDVLISLDQLTTTREIEHGYLASDAFPRLMKMNNVTLG